MRRPISILLWCLPVGGCGEVNPPSAYRHGSDRLLAALPLAAISDDFVPCYRTIDGRPGKLPDGDCYRFGEPRRRRGVAILGFEARAFFPGRTTPPPEGERSEYRLSIEPGTLPPVVRSRCEAGCLVYLDFVGRQTSVRGRYGHMGAGRHLILVDRMTKAELIGQDSTRRDRAGR